MTIPFDPALPPNNLAIPPQSRQASHEQTFARSAPSLHALAAAAWNDLPYTMMQLTAAKRPWDHTRVYWRDQQLQLGDVLLDLEPCPENQELQAAARTGVSAFRATFRRDEMRHQLSLHPSLFYNELRWSAPEISGGEKLTTRQLGERLLSRLVTLYTSELP